jgi:hypothetical protein
MESPMSRSQGFRFVLVVRGRRRRLDGVVTVGRSPACDIVLHRDEEASRLHARFSLQTDGAYLEDLLSTNGTFVGGERVIGRRKLELLDLVRVGSSLISVHEAEDVHPELEESPALHSDRSPITVGDTTRPADIFEVLERVALNAIEAGRPSDAESVTAAHLGRLIDEVREGSADPEHVESALRIGLALTQHVSTSRWLEYVVQLHAALQRPLAPELLRLGAAAGLAGINQSARPSRYPVTGTLLRRAD